MKKDSLGPDNELLHSNLVHPKTKQKIKIIPLPESLKYELNGEENLFTGIPNEPACDCLRVFLEKVESPGTFGKMITGLHCASEGCESKYLHEILADLNEDKFQILKDFSKGEHDEGSLSVQPSHKETHPEHYEGENFGNTNDNSHLPPTNELFNEMHEKHLKDVQQEDTNELSNYMECLVKANNFYVSEYTIDSE